MKIRPTRRVAPDQRYFPRPPGSTMINLSRKLPLAPHPAVTSDARQGGDEPSSTSSGLHHRHQSASNLRVHSPQATSCRTKGLSFETRGREWVRVTPRSTSLSLIH